ncbi:hypothetical protein E8E12_008201 [Didymella heteroderae]|uniref:DUF1989 domain-containing protein n=1 Tax=Didymella heteroderae TaxID=1769908 RepID=A0A9P4WP12_9PLEO|nr:hypothetical protein E8E12_008201 [Didymella heteroderae]
MFVTHTVPARRGAATIVRANQKIKITNTHGNQVVDTWVFALPSTAIGTSSSRLEAPLYPAASAASSPAYSTAANRAAAGPEFMSMSHCRATLLKLIPSVGDTLVSQKRAPLVKLIEDTSPGIHDTLIAACDRWSHDGREAKRSRILGLLGLPDRTQILHNLRRIEITVSIDEFTAFKADSSERRRVQIDYFLEVIKLHAEDRNKRSLFQPLEIHLVSLQDLSGSSHRTYTYHDISPSADQTQFDEHITTLERLVDITDIQEAKFTGLPEWFAICLTMRIRGKGRDHIDEEVTKKQATGLREKLSEKLLPEILRRVCEYALPQGLKFSFQGGGSSWDLYVQEGSRPCIKVARGAAPENHIANKHSEARAVFFHGNAFILTIGSMAHRPVSLKSSLIFGPLGLPHRLQLLRDLRQIELDIVIDEHEDETWGFRRQQARIQHFVDIIQQHAEDKDKNKKSLLQRLQIRITLRPYLRWHSKDPVSWESVINRASALEPLTSISGIDEIGFFSLSHSAGEQSWRWFGQCLALRMLGEGGELKKVEWSPRTSKRRGNPGETRKSERAKAAGEKKETVVVTKTTKKTDDPTFDCSWVEFARRIRNGIDVPISAERYFPHRRTT